MAKARKITSKEDIDFLLGITEDTITKTLMMKMFGKFKTAPRFDPTDEVIILAKFGGFLGKPILRGGK